MSRIGINRFQLSRVCGGLLICCVVLAFYSSFAETNRVVSLPSKVVTLDGKGYDAPKLVRVFPDGLLVQYQAASGGMGMATLKFTNLPEPFQMQFGYNPTNAAAFESARAQATAEMTQTLRQNEKTREAAMAKLEASTISKSDRVILNYSKPTVRYEYYDPNGVKPAELGPWRAEASRHLHFNPEVELQTSDKKSPFAFYVEKVTMTTSMETVIIQPQNKLAQLMLHEEGHRKINEHFYLLTPKVAQRIGEQMIGNRFLSNADDFASAKADATAQANAALRSGYDKYVSNPARDANEYYDNLSGHTDNSDLFINGAIQRYDPHL